MARDKLTLRIKTFCDEYAANGGIGKKAAIAAGYKESDATNRASIILNMACAKEYLASLIKELDSQKIAKISEVQAFWTLIMRGGMLDDGYPAKLSDRIKASELLARSQGAFIEKLQVSGANGESLPTINLNFVKPTQMGLFDE
jgi:phage terminase small subunit